MTLDDLLQWGLTIVGSGGIGAIITYLSTYKSSAKIAKEHAEQEHISTEDQQGKMERDRFEAMYTQITEMAKDYNDLSDQFREYRKTARAIEIEFDEKLRQRSSELARLKDEVHYLKKLRCYNMDCPNRIKELTEE